MTKEVLNAGYISSFSMELYLILQAGIPLGEGLDILAGSEDNQQLRQTLMVAAEAMGEGQPLHQALEEARVFPRYMLDMIRVGEETGNLDRCLKGLSTYYDRQEQLEQNIRRAVLYPAVLLAMLTLVLGVLIVKVLPMFQDVYAQLGGTLTGLGGAILTLGTCISDHWLATILVILALVVATLLVVRQGGGDGRRVLLSKKLGLAVATSKLASAFAMALQSGLDTDMTMALAEELTQHPDLREKVGRCRQQMAQGEGFAVAVAGQGIFSSLHCRMLEVGMRTGSMDQVMEDIARRCDGTAQEDIDRYVGSVEPTLVMVMSVLVGVVLLSVMLPLASIMTALG